MRYSTTVDALLKGSGHHPDTRAETGLGRIRRYLERPNRLAKLLDRKAAKCQRLLRRCPCDQSTMGTRGENFGCCPN